MARLAIVLQEDAVAGRVEEEEATVLVVHQGVALGVMALQVAAMVQEEILGEALVDTALLAIAMDHQAILVVEAGAVEVEVLLGEVMVPQVALVVEVEDVVIVVHQVETTEGAHLEGLVDTAPLAIVMDHQEILVVEAVTVEVVVLLGEVMVPRVALVVEVEAVVVVVHQVETTEGARLEAIMVLQADQAVEEEGVGEEVPLGAIMEEDRLETVMDPLDVEVEDAEGVVPREETMLVEAH